MKRIVLQAANAFCIMFTVLMGWFLAMGYLFAGPSYGLNLTASLLAAALGMAALQALWFTNALFKRLAYPARIAGFGACGLPVIALCAWLGQWIPADVGASAWVAFVVIYLVILAGVTLGYTVHFKKTAGSYDAALEHYRKQNRE